VDHRPVVEADLVMDGLAAGLLDLEGDPWAGTALVGRRDDALLGEPREGGIDLHRRLLHDPVEIGRVGEIPGAARAQPAQAQHR
jgi:hypothetical protein